jgi:hypothetical protein
LDLARRNTDKGIEESPSQGLKDIPITKRTRDIGSKVLLFLFEEPKRKSPRPAQTNARSVPSLEN